MIDLQTFLDDERGAVAMDAVVLTALLVGTTLAVVGTFSEGLESLATVGPHVQLRDDEADTRGEGTLCTGGTAAVQLQENGRANALGEAPLDVALYMRETYAGKTAEQLREELADAQEDVRGDEVWTIDRTRLGAVECELVLRGLD